MRLIATDLLPKTSSLVEGLSDGLTGFLTYMAQFNREPALTEDVLYRPVAEIATFEGWKITRNVPVMVGPSANDQALVNFLLRFEPQDSPAMSQCVLLQVVLNLETGGKPVSVDVELKALLELKILMARDIRYADHQLTSLLMLAGHHKRLFGQTRRRQLASPRYHVSHLDTFACHAGRTDFGVTIYRL